MSMEWIKRNYSVPVKKGARVEYTGGKKPKLGTITGTEGQYILIRLDAEKVSHPYHPTWKLRYLDATTGGAS